MSILNAIKQQGGAIDDLSKLPQAMIMQMVQKKQIDEAMLAPILARKAEMADAIARNKTLQAGGGQMPSVMEQLMQKTADQEQPEPQAREMGVAQLPMKEGMYDEQRMAGGGIVAFQAGGSTNDAPPREPNESENDYLKRVAMVSELGGQFFTPRNYDPIAKLKDLYGSYERNVGQPFAEGVKRFVNETPEEQAAKFRSYSQQPKTEATALAKAPKATDAQYEEQGKNAYVSTPVKPGIKSLVPASESPTSAAKVKQSALQKATGAPEMTETKIDPVDALIAKYEKMIAGDPEAAAAAKKEAMWSRLAEAGLGIMGGTSTNFAENVGKGATQAMKGYAEDVKGLRAEEAAKMSQLMGLGLKGAALKQEALKLGITEKHFDQMYKAQMAQIGEMGASRRDTAALRADTATDNRVLNAAKMLAARPENQSLSDEELYNKATKLVTGQGTQPTFPGFSGRPLK